jgi:hypothetical protein
MRAGAEMRADELREARAAADTLISEKFRSYLPGRMLAMLLGRFRDDLAESLGMELPPLPRRCGLVKAVTLGSLAADDLETLTSITAALATRFTALMDDPLLPRLLGEFRDALAAETAGRARIAGEGRQAHATA